MRVRSALAAVAPVLAALPFVGAGPRNGDVVGYLWQAATGHPWDRATHAGYVLLVGPIVAVVPRGSEPLALDLVSVGACALAASVVASSRQLPSTGPTSGPMVGAAVGVALLPIAAFAEVDPVWWSLLAMASVTGTRLVGPLVAGAVAVSPAALLALPWLVVTRRTEPRAIAAAVVGAALVVLGLSLASHGAWWWGERGVLRADLSSVGGSPAAWLAGLPWLWLPALALAWRDLPDRAGVAAELAAAVPLLALPADVPGVVVVGLWGARLLARVPARLAAASIVLQVAWTTGAVALERSRVRDENARIEAAARALGEGEGLVAPFTIGARMAWARTGDPYGLAWHPPGGWLRDQRRRWCGAPPSRAWRWEDGLVELPPAAVAEGCP